MNPEEIPAWTAFLKRNRIFRDLVPEHLNEVASRLKALSLPKGATLYSRGDPGDALYLITSGQVKLLGMRQGEEVVLAFLGRGDALGEMSILTGEKRSVTVKLETTSEFLMLAKQDFDEVIQANPSILMQLSRIIAQRMLQANQSGGPKKEARRQILVMADALPERMQALVLPNLAMGILEQSRKRTLLVEMGPHGGSVAKAMGLVPVRTSEAMLREMDLRDPEILDRMVTVHPSGLRVLTFPASVLAGRLFRGIFLFMNLLRENHDFVLIHLGKSLGEVERSILAEADQWVLLGAKGHEAEWNEVESGIQKVESRQKRVTGIWVSDSDRPLFSGEMRDSMTLLPWSDALTAEYDKGVSPFDAVAKFPKSGRVINRLARRLCGLSIGLAMGSGAALGYSLIGVLKGLRKANIDIDLIAGTSMGALMAGFYASGMELEDMEKLARGVDKSWIYENLFWDMTIPRSSLFAGVSLLRFFKSQFKDVEFHQLQLPFACVATDIETGEAVILKEGRVAEAVRASCGIPLLFAPFHHQGRFLVDGGLVDPIPSRVVAQMGADIIISVNLTLPATKRKSAVRQRHEKMGMPLTHLGALNPLKNLGLPELLRSPNMFEILFQMIYTMEYGIAQSRLDPAHVLIQPEVSDFSWTELHRAKEIVMTGERAAAEAEAKIKSFLPYFSGYCEIPSTQAKWKDY